MNFDVIREQGVIMQLRGGELKSADVYTNRDDVEFSPRDDVTPQVAAALQQLRRQSQRYSDICGELGSRLQPILNPVVNEKRMVGDKTAGDGVCPLALEIAVLADFFRDANNLMADMLERLEL